jgi:hypothetical protein
MTGLNDMTGAEGTEYVVMVSWRPVAPDEAEGGKSSIGESWTEANRWSSFKELNAKLERKIGRDKMQASAPFPSTVVSSSKEKRQQLRKERLQTYLDDVFGLVDADPTLAKHVSDLEQMLGLNIRMSKIKRAVAMRNDALKNGEDEGGDDNDVHVYPMNAEEIVQAGTLVQQLWRLLKAHPEGSDIRQNENVQKMLSSALGLLPQLKESARVGPFTIMALLPYAQQYLADVKNTFRYYNDLALMAYVHELRNEYGLTGNDWKEEWAKHKA